MKSITSCSCLFWVLRWEIVLTFVLYSILWNLFIRIWYAHLWYFRIRIRGIFVERWIDLWYKWRCIHARVGNAFTILLSDNTFLYINYHHHRWNILNSRVTSYTSKTSSKECWLYLPMEFHAWFKIPISDQYFGILYNTQLLLHTK